MIKYLKALRMNHIKSQIEERRTKKIKSLHKPYWKTYIEILIESLVHDKHIENKHKQTNRVHPITKKKRWEAWIRAATKQLSISFSVALSLCVCLG